MTEQITWAGSSAATSGTRSHAPRPDIPSTMTLACSVIQSENLATIRGRRGRTPEARPRGFVCQEFRASDGSSIL
jgi:hypothetical protein